MISKFNCPGDPSLFGTFDVSYAPPLLFYSYVPVIAITLLVGLFILFKDRFSRASVLLFALSFTFSIFILNEILLWITVPVALVYFGWSLSLLLSLLILIFTLYFNYVFVYQRDLPFNLKVLISILLLPGLILLPTTFNVSTFDIGLCEGITGKLWYYLYTLEVASILVFLSWGIGMFRKYRLQRSQSSLQSVYLLFSTAFFLTIYFASYFYGEVTRLFEINLIGPIGMLVFIGVLSYMIVRFKIFNIKLLSAQVLVFALIMLIGSQLFFIKSKVNFVLTCFTLILASIGGYFLVRSVVKEVKQREEIEKLAENLRLVNERLRALDKMKSEFVSIASHQLRSPLTSIRGYASMLAEGSYGKLSAKVQEITERIAESGKYMALSIEDYLNVSRIEAGNMKYEKSDFNLKEMAEKIVDEMRPVALKKGLVMVFRSDCDGSCEVHADIGKTRQAIMNILDNSMKYTPKGTITVVAHDDLKKKTVRVTIQDTGVGMNKEALEELFNKFVRAKNANQVNVSGSGLGLYIARKMVTDMGGNIWAESEGEGKGSTFIIEFPLLSSKATAR